MDTIIGNKPMFSHSDTPDRATPDSGFMSNYNISSDQLNLEIEESDVTYLAAHFDNVEPYLNILGLTNSEQVHVRRTANLSGNQVAMAECLSLWRHHNPSIATLRTLLDILLKLRKEDVAVKICSYFHPKPKKQSKLKVNIPTS